MEYLCTEERFLKDVESHEMKIIQDEGINRHISFMRFGDSSYSFNLITWYGSLCISGDCGTFVFNRIEDMFKFFRNEKSRINPCYWGEKLTSISRFGGYEVHSSKKFKEAVERSFDQHYEDCPDKEEMDECWAKLEDEVLSLSTEEWRGPIAATDFTYYDFHLADFWEANLKEYSFHFIWCLYAIVWGIGKYDNKVSKVAQNKI